MDSVFPVQGKSYRRHFCRNSTNIFPDTRQQAYGTGGAFVNLPTFSPYFFKYRGSCNGDIILRFLIPTPPIHADIPGFSAGAELEIHRIAVENSHFSTISTGFSTSCDSAAKAFFSHFSLHKYFRQVLTFSSVLFGQNNDDTCSGDIKIGT